MKKEDSEFGTVLFKATFAPELVAFMVILCSIFWLLIVDALFLHNLYWKIDGSMLYFMWFFFIVFSLALISLIRMIFIPYVFLTATDRGIVTRKEASAGRNRFLLVPWEQIDLLNLVMREYSRAGKRYKKEFIAIRLLEGSNLPIDEVTHLNDGSGTIYLDAFSTKPGGRELLDKLKEVQRIYSLPTRRSNNEKATQAKSGTNHAPETSSSLTTHGNGTKKILLPFTTFSISPYFSIAALLETIFAITFCAGFFFLSGAVLAGVITGSPKVHGPLFLVITVPPLFIMVSLYALYTIIFRWWAREYITIDNQRIAAGKKVAGMLKQTFSSPVHQIRYVELEQQRKYGPVLHLVAEDSDAYLGAGMQQTELEELQRQISSWLTKN